MLLKIHKVRRPHPAFIFQAFMGFPFPIQASGPHTQAAPSMPAVPTHPRGFPHMPAPFSHTFPRLPQSPHADADPHRFSRPTIRFRGSPILLTSSKKPDSNPDETSVSGPANPQPIMPNRSPGPASHLRKSSANQVTQILQTCGWGWRRHVRAHGHGHVRAYLYNGHTCTAMRAPSRPWSHPFASILTLPGTFSTRPARTALADLRANPVHSDSNVQPLGGMDDGVAATCRRQGGPAPACMIGPGGPMIVRPEGRTCG